MARQAGLPSVLFAREMLKFIGNTRREGIRNPELIKKNNNSNNTAPTSSATASSTELTMAALKNEVSACIKDPRYRQ